ncbi:MAG TPA: exodeoxyribonuclease III [Xanthobacteraceae bacterium]|jgi:exodeoxyribonuclease-3|nr:MAG: exodeoxyribonuclease III [Rhizobiales bacterium 12-66-7]OYY80239.1 MAG: exodeoxyribonuclease III [Rhizobiales bacterium 35-66-30]OZA94000.1 MAG: exodeoxyribonuclease III [Rhizobiales bacterium 39-66-18]HQS09238.1 exodeoxyribonuclease III [Xanthobacteraceae bacterium]
MRIATWNVNSIRQRLDHAVRWLGEAQPDVVCLQEIKCQTEAFPREPFEALGYNVSVHGQKTFNGVAMLSKLPLEDVTHGLAGNEEDVQARFIEAVISTKGGAVRVCCLYLPNGNPVGTEKYPYKLNFLERLHAFAADRLALEEPLLLCGDFNVIPAEADAADPSAWVNDALFLPQTREAFRALTHLGLVDAVRATSDSAKLYSFWDYQAGAFQRDLGIRIDHLLLSPQAADTLIAAGIDKHVRAWEKPSDHVPVWVDLKIAA